jgi:hypothetical protein
MPLSQHKEESNFLFLKKLPNGNYLFFGKEYLYKPSKFFVLSFGKRIIIGTFMLALSYLFDNKLSSYSPLFENPYVYHLVMGILIIGGLLLIALDAIAYRRL